MRFVLLRLGAIPPRLRAVRAGSTTPVCHTAAFTTSPAQRNASHIDDTLEQPKQPPTAHGTGAGSSDPHPPQLPRPTPDVRHVRAHPRLHAANCSLRGYAELVGHPARVASLSGRLHAVDGRIRAFAGRKNGLVARLLKPAAAAAAADGGQAAKREEEAESDSEDVDGEEAKLRAEIRSLGEASAALLAEAAAVRAEIARLAGELPVLMVEGVGDGERVLDVFEPENKTAAGAHPITTSLLESMDGPAATDGSSAPKRGAAPVRLAPSPPATHPRQRASHVEIGRFLDLLALAPEAAAIAGHGHYFLLNAGMRLERALVEHALRAATAAGFAPVAPPSIVYRAVAGACGFRPRAGAGSEIFDVSASQAAGHAAAEEALHGPAAAAAPGHVLAGTAEIPLAGMYAGRTLTSAESPARLVGVSRCFRAEAGARGRRDRGLFRVHEFTKVELFAWCAPDREPAPGARGEGAEGEEEAGPAQRTWYDAGLEARCPRPDGHSYVDASARAEAATPAAADDVDGRGPPPPLPRHLDPATDAQSARLFRQMLELQLAIHRPLGLHLRTLLLPAHDLGASAALKVDVEALFHGGGDGAASDRWGEICSLALCADYQARRLGVRVEGRGASGERVAPRFAWSLNGTALAVPRVWAALVEQGWDEARGAVRLPECLWGLMGMREIRKQ
jgi:seryl-tRNA synthetase